MLPFKLFETSNGNFLGDMKTQHLQIVLRSSIHRVEERTSKNEFRMMMFKSKLVLRINLWAGVNGERFVWLCCAKAIGKYVGRSATLDVQYYYFAGCAYISLAVAKLCSQPFYIETSHSKYLRLRVSYCAVIARLKQ